MSGFKTLFGGSSVPSEEEAFNQLEDLRDQVEIARIHLEDPKETEFIPVTIPTVMAIWETERLIRTLFEVHFPVKRIYVNQLQPENPDCSYCAARFETQKKNIERIHELYSEYQIKEVPMFEYEVRGVESLRKLSQLLYN